ITPSRRCQRLLTPCDASDPPPRTSLSVSCIFGATKLELRSKQRGAMNMHSQHRARGRSTPLFVLLSLCVLGPACGDDPDAASDDVVIGDTEGGTTGDVPAETGDDPPPPGPDPDSGAPSDDSDGDETD